MGNNTIIRGRGQNIYRDFVDWKYVGRMELTKLMGTQVNLLLEEEWRREECS